MIPAMDSSELAKLPALLEHFQEHKSENQDLSFFAFVKLHYANSQHHQQDHQEHHELPFSSHHQHNCSVHQVIYTVPNLAFVLHHEPATQENQVEYQTPSDLVLSTSIWQPPRLG